jgi:type I restriction enzyme, S subunit
MKYKKVPLDEVSEIIAGQSPESKYYNQTREGIPFFQGKADFTENYPNVRYWCTQKTKIAKPHDILLSVRAPVGPTNICNIEACIGRGLAAIRVGNKLDYKYLYYFMKFNEANLASKGNGSTFSAITSSDIREIQIPLPPLPTQKRIAEILDAADALRRKDQALLKKYDELAQSIFIDMFGDPVKNEKGWEVKKLKEVCKVQGGYSFKSTDLKKEGIRLVKIANVNFGSMSWDDVDFLPSTFLEKYKGFSLKENDLCMALTRPIIKSLNSVKVVKVSKNDIPSLLNQRVGRFQLNEKCINRTYLLHFIYTNYFKDKIEKYSSTSLQPNVSSTQIENIEIILPDLLVQQKFELLINNLEFQKNELTTFYSESLFNSLLQKAFNGELVA